MSSEAVDRVVLERATDSLAHRGPDGRGIHIDHQACLGLGHRRLAILDLSTSGSQPMCYLNRYHIVYNGEVFNFLELKEDLVAHGHILTSDTDTEVVLAAYAQWGAAMQTRLNGMWALAVWDEKEQTLFLSRDRFGIKPRFFVHEEGRFAFASEMKAFLHLPGFPGGLDESVALRTLYEPLSVEAGPDCLMRGVRRLRAGHCLTVSRERPPVDDRWWRTLDHLDRVPMRYADQVTRFREGFSDACRLRMRSDVPLATALSGGLDSSSVLCMMHGLKSGSSLVRVPSDWQTSFVLVYPDSPSDESGFARQVIDHVGNRGLCKTITPEEVEPHVDDVLFHLEDIYYDIPVGLWVLYREMGRHGVRVSLDGHGGDELLAGYHHHMVLAMADAWERMRPLRFLSLYRTLQDMNPPGAGFKPPTLRYIRKKPRLPEYAMDHEDFRADLPDLAAMGHLGRMLYYDVHFNSLPAILRNFDRMSMAHGVEIRTPLLDWRLVCLAFSLPEQAKVGKGVTKRILRSAMRGLMPETIRTRKSKIGFVHPKTPRSTPHWNYLMAAVHDPDFLTCPLFDGPGIRDQMDRADRSGNCRHLTWPEPFIMAVRLGKLLSPGVRSMKKEQ